VYKCKKEAKNARRPQPTNEAPGALSEKFCCIKPDVAQIRVFGSPVKVILLAGLLMIA
jgi:hypothetical protein